MAVFKTPEYAEVTLSNWLTHTPAALVAQHLKIDPAVLEKLRNDQPGFMRSE